jgi:hypothetical protein
VRKKRRGQNGLSGGKYMYFDYKKGEMHLMGDDMGTVWIFGVNIYPKANVLPLSFASTNICPLRCLDEGVNVGRLFI